VIGHELLHLKLSNHVCLLNPLMSADLGDREASAERLQQAATSCSGPPRAAAAGLR